MYHVSVKNLYIGKLGLDLIMRTSNSGVSYSPTVLIGDIMMSTMANLEVPRANQDIYPDFVLSYGLFTPSRKFIINPPETQEKHSLWVTGIPLNTDIAKYMANNCIYKHYYQDQYRGYLTQVINGQQFKLFTENHKLYTL